MAGKRVPVVYGLLLATLVAVGSTAVIVLAEQPGRELDGQEPAPLLHDLPEHTYLGASATATDVWSLQCGPLTYRTRALVDDGRGADGVRFTLTLVDPRGRAVGRTGPDGDTTSVSLTGGPGNYLVIVTKTPGGTVEDYQGYLQCEQLTGQTAVHNIMLLQNQ
jgi:hypothetical protein